MTRLEFSVALRGALAGLDDQEIEKSVQFYDEMIVDHMDEGMAEEDAVASIGSAEEVAREIMLDMPVAKLVKRRVRGAKRASFWGIVAIIVGSPVWMPLLIALVAVVLSLYVSMWAVVASLWATVGALAFAAPAALIGFTLNAGGLMILGAALGALGIAIVLAFATLWMTKMCVLIGRGFVRGVKRTVVGGRKGDGE